MLSLGLVKKGTTAKNTGRFGLLFFCLTWAPLPARAADSEKRLDQLNDCNWIVTYRGRTYDLAPLTREALARPIETDIRYALQRVPAASEHLHRMNQRLRDARVHSMLASVFLAGALVTRLLHSGQDQNADRNRTLNVLTFASGGFFLGGIYQSWRATRDAKDELVRAVEVFNEESPQKIEPAPNGRPLPEAPVDLTVDPTQEEASDSEKNRP